MFIIPWLGYQSRNGGRISRNDFTNKLLLVFIWNFGQNEVSYTTLKGLINCMSHQYQVIDAPPIF